MALFIQPVRAYIRATALVVMCSITPHAAAAGAPQPSIRELARNEVTRMVAAGSRASTVPYPPNYPQTFRPLMPSTKAGRRVAFVTLGAVGGLIAGAMIGAGIGCIHPVEDCALTGLVGAPIGAAAGAVTVVVLTR
jgi:hypothetical protein